MRWPNFYQIFFRPFFFQMDPEKAHHLILTLARLIWRIPLARKLTHFIFARKIPENKFSVGSVEFQNQVGLAAGFDKNGVLVPGIENLGFGFVEIGTVTPKPQLGNPRPRIFREPEKKALVNRLGFNNDGAEIIAGHLKHVRSKITVPLGINLGKNRDTPNTEAVKDYESLLKTFRSLADYFTINISSPNTPGLRDLQSEPFLKQLSEKVMNLRLMQPVFIKLSPDIAFDDLKMICGMCGPQKPFVGLILCNTLPTDMGGMSGAPLKPISLLLLKQARTLLDKTVPIISVGGIFSYEDALERLQNGATAVQLYTGLIYQGPGLPGKILRRLAKQVKT